MWRPVEAMLKAELAAADATLREATDRWKLARAQGRAGLCQELLDLAAKARS